MAFWDVYAIVSPHLNLMSVEDELVTVDVHRRIAQAARAGDPAALTARTGNPRVTRRQTSDVTCPGPRRHPGAL